MKLWKMLMMLVTTVMVKWERVYCLYHDDKVRTSWECSWSLMMMSLILDTGQ